MLRYMQWLQVDEELITKEFKKVQVYEFKHVNDEQIMDEWAKHFRQNYCLDDELDEEMDGLDISREEFLIKFKFPDEKIKPGPSIRAGDFSELLVVDYMEFILGYYVPRTRYDAKIIKNESTKGSDILAFKVISEKFSSEDILLVNEVKGSLSASSNKDRLQDAVNDSKKDFERLAESLLAAKQRLRSRGESDKVKLLRRFQNIADRPYVLKYGASAVIDNIRYDKKLVSNTTIAGHPNKDILLIVIRGNEMMKLTHELYRRASLC